MAYAIQILAKINRSDKEEIVFEPMWWNYREIWEAHDFIRTGEYAYTDYLWDLNKDELIGLLKSQEKYLNNGIYADEKWIAANNEELSGINNMLREINENSDLKIRIYEWDY